METRIIECVPNFSEGRNPEIIKSITDAIESVEGIRLLDVDPGEATNRTVVTLGASPGSTSRSLARPQTVPSLPLSGLRNWLWKRPSEA